MAGFRLSGFNKISRQVAAKFARGNIYNLRLVMLLQQSIYVHTSTGVDFMSDNCCSCAAVSARVKPFCVPGCVSFH
jgi:hypothetical protein